MSSSSSAVVCLVLASYCLRGSYANFALAQTDSLISSRLATRDVDLSDSLFGISVDTTSLDENLVLNEFLGKDELNVNDLADVSPVAFDLLSTELFTTDPTSNFISELGSQSELNSNDNIILTSADTGLLSAQDYCLPNYTRKSRKKRDDSTCPPGQQPQTGTLSLPNLLLEDDEENLPKLEDRPSVGITDGYPKKCPNGWAPFGRVFGVACDGPLSLSIWTTVIVWFLLILRNANSVSQKKKKWTQSTVRIAELIDGMQFWGNIFSWIKSMLVVDIWM